MSPCPTQGTQSRRPRTMHDAKDEKTLSPSPPLFSTACPDGAPDDPKAGETSTSGQPRVSLSARHHPRLLAGLLALSLDFVHGWHELGQTRAEGGSLDGVHGRRKPVPRTPRQRPPTRQSRWSTGCCQHKLRRRRTNCASDSRRRRWCHRHQSRRRPSGASARRRAARSGCWRAGRWQPIVYRGPP